MEDSIKKTGYFQGANTSYISANIIDRKSGTPLLSPYVIKQIDGINIGFIGVVTKRPTCMWHLKIEKK